MGTEKVKVSAEAEGKRLSRKMTAKRASKRVTVGGMTEDHLERILVDLMRAVHEYDLVTLQVHLSEAMKQGVDPTKTATAEELFNKMHGEEFILSKLEEERNNLNSGNNISLRVKQLSNLKKQAISLGVDDERLTGVNRDLQKGVRSRARETVK